MLFSPQQIITKVYAKLHNIFYFPEFYSFNKFLDHPKNIKFKTCYCHNRSGTFCMSCKNCIVMCLCIYIYIYIYTTEKHVIDPCDPIHSILIGRLWCIICLCVSVCSILKVRYYVWHNEAVKSRCLGLIVAVTHSWLVTNGPTSPLVLPCQGCVCVRAYECVSRLCCFQDMTL